MPEKDVTPLAWKIELLLMDVDGVMTDGRLLLVPMPDGSVVEAKAFGDLPPTPCPVEAEESFKCRVQADTTALGLEGE